MYEDDTDYGALFGVTPDAEGQESAQDPEEQEGAGAEETEPEGQGAAGGPEGQEPAQKPEGQEEPEGREPQPDDRQMELSPEAEAEQSGLCPDEGRRWSCEKKIGEIKKSPCIFPPGVIRYGLR